MNIKNQKSKIKNFLNYLLKEIEDHLFQYLLLVTGSVFFLLLLGLSKENRLIQFLTLTLFTTFYILWGIIHHLLEKTLHLKVVVEYIMIGAIALFLLKIFLIP